ncbi:adenosylcobalamin-dependent ribonucleoside-diphosphate reductase [Candidatus Woesearchaeota archaeon]|nr:adenosylcobalamin-dependent ribonucleoside-diphosphate reductase [Candidatus Woesearchaeota archaeon]
MQEIRLSSHAREILKKRYLLKDNRGKVIETPEQMFKRVAKAVSKANKKLEKEFYTLMSNLDFLPNSPTLMNSGTELSQLSACFVLPVEDSITSIFDTLKNAALIFQTGGGCGYNFSKIRPKGDIIRSTKGIASGPLSFMTIFDKTSDVMKKGGKRRGANMGILDYTHPDIMEFVKSKRDGKSLQNFNISVAVDSRFFKIVRDNKSFNLINSRTGKPHSKLNARTLFNEIVESAWLTGDPGLIFIDEINKKNPLRQKIRATNPCGEAPLLPYESCNLGSINLSNFVSEASIDYARLKSVIKSSVIFLNNVIDINKYPLKEIEHATKKHRKIGLGVMGFADMLVKLGIRYDAQEALDTAEQIMHFINTEARAVSKKHSKRNTTVTTIAPTGSISLIADCSSGIEPIFAREYTRIIMDKKNKLKHKLFKKESSKYFVTSHEVSPEHQVKMLAAFQKYVDNGVSKTVNMKATATKSDIAAVFKLAHKLKCKGITVYRDKSKETQILCKVC